MIKKLITTSAILGSILEITAAYAGYGIDCATPSFFTSATSQSISFRFTCTNNTVATFSSFSLSLSEWDTLEPARLHYSVTWPHSETDIRPNDVGVVTGSIYFPALGKYKLDFNKAYGGERYTGIFCANGAHPQSCPKFSVTPFLLVTDIFNNEASSCSIDLNGELMLCQDTGSTYSAPAGIATLTLNNQMYSYVANAFNTSSNSVTQCQVDPSTALFSACQSGAVLPSTYNTGIAFNRTPGQIYAYVAGNYVTSTIYGYIYLCDVDSTTGLFSACNPSGPIFNNGPLLSITHRFNGVDYLYVPDGNNGAPNQQVWQCRLNPITGQLPVNCEDSGAGAIFNGPSAIVFVTVGGNEYAYVSAYNSPNLYVCPVNTTTGKLSSCTVALGNIGQPNGLKSVRINHTSYLYLADTTDNVVVRCIVKSDGNFKDCVQSDPANPNTMFGGPFDIAFGPVSVSVL